MRACLRLAAVAAFLLLAACGGLPGGGWVKPGADESTAAAAYRDCLALSDTAARTDTDIDQDIAASRASDLQHSSVMQQGVQSMREQSGDRAAAILASCMQAKGFTRSK